MTAAGALAIEHDIIPHTIPLRQNIHRTWKPKLVSLTREEASQSENQIKTYRISFMGVSEAQKAQFHNSRCMFLVSVGQHYHEGAKLEAALKCMNQHFTQVIVVIGDTIQRYPFAICQNKDPEELHSFAESEGSKWLERNTPIIQRSLTKLHEVYRWDRYALHPKFAAYHKDLDNALQLNDNGLRACIEQDAREYLDRLIKNGIKLAPNSMELCLQYLMNECVCMRLFAEEGCEFYTYPYGINRVVAKIREIYIQKTRPDVMCEVLYSIKCKS